MYAKYFDGGEVILVSFHQLFGTYELPLEDAALIENYVKVLGLFGSQDFDRLVVLLNDGSNACLMGVSLTDNTLGGFFGIVDGGESIACIRYAMTNIEGKALNNESYQRLKSELLEFMHLRTVNN